VWLVFNLPPSASSAPLPSIDDVIDRWDAEGLDLRSARAKVQANPEFLRQILGQEAVFHQLAQYRRGRPAAPRIELHLFGWDEYWDILRSTPVDRRPDLAQIPSSWCSSLASDLGVLAPLTGERERQIASDIDTRFVEPCRVNGSGPIHGVPWLLDVRMLFFWRNDLPDLERNLQLSSSARDAFRTSLKASPVLASHPPFGLPTARDWELLHQFFLLVRGQGGELVRRTGFPGYHWDAAAFREPALHAAEYLGGLAKDGLLVLPRETRQTLEGRFIEHRLGSIVSGPWLLGLLPPTSLSEIGMVIPPFYDDVPVTFAGGSLLGLTNRAPAMNGPAWELATFLVAGKAALPLANAAGLIPASRRIRGSAAAAMSRLPDIERGEPCGTYFECVLARTRVGTHVNQLERGLAVSRSLPAHPDWWQLEVPSRLGSLYHFWQELAALQQRDSLDVSLQTAANEWDEVLTRPWQRLQQALLLLASATITASVIALVVFRHQRQMKAHAAMEIEIVRRLAHQATAELKAFKELILQVAANPSIVEAAVEWVDRTGRLRAEPSRPYVITLPSAQLDKLTIDHHGHSTGDIESPAARLIDYTVRQSLLQQASRQEPIQFSIVTAAMVLWNEPGSSIADGRTRLETIVAGMRKAFNAKAPKVIGRGEQTVYAWKLPESEYQCRIAVSSRNPGVPPTPMDFAKAVRAPFIEALERRERGELPEAFAAAVHAFAGEADLARKDIAIVLLVCELAAAIDGPLEPDAQHVLTRAREELQSAADAYERFFTTFGSLEALRKHFGGIAETRGLVAHWEAFQQQRQRIQRLTAAPHDASTAPTASTAAAGSIPADVHDEWSFALELLPNVDAKAYRKRLRYVLPSGVTDAEVDQFNNAFGRIVVYWARATISQSIDAVQKAIESCRLDNGAARPIEAWTREMGTEHIAALIDNGLRAQMFPEADDTHRGLDAALYLDFKQSLENGRKHPLLKLLDVAAPHQDRLRAMLLAETWTSDFASYISHVYEKAVALRKPKGGGAGGSPPTA
jgi:hypothetical protein